MADQEPRPLVPERRRRLLILAICSMSLLIVGLDNTIVNVALPAIHRSLHSSVSGLQWVIDAYTLVLASLLMLSGSMGDRLGRRRVFQIGLTVFLLGSLACALAPSLGFLVGARVLQAIGGSMLNPIAMSIIRNVFTDPRERSQAIGVWGGVFGISMALGPVVGGALVVSVGWRWVFLVNLPIGLAAIVLTALFVPESRAERVRRLDPLGQLLVIAALGALTYSIIDGPRSGWTSAQTLALFGIALISLVTLIVHELRREQPLIEVRFFRSAPFSGATAIAVAGFAALGGFMFLNTLYLQDVRGLSPLEAGLYMLPLAGLTVIIAPISGHLVSRRGSRLSLVTGSLAVLASGLILTQLATRTSPGVLIAAYALFGIGYGFINPPITDTAVAGMPSSQAGVAAAVASTSRQVGQTLGVAVLGALAGGGVTGVIGRSFARQTHVSFWITVGLGAAIFVIAWLSTGRRAHDSARRTAERLRESSRSERPEAERRPSSTPAGAAAR